MFYLLLNAFYSFTGDYNLIKKKLLSYFVIDLSLIVREIETKRDNK